MDSNSESVWYGAPPAPETMSAPEPQHEDERHVRLRTDARYFLLLSLALGAVFALLFVNAYALGLNAALLAAAMAAATLLALGKLGLREKKRDIFWSVSLVLLGLSIAWTANYMTQNVSFLGMFIAELLWLMNAFADILVALRARRFRRLPARRKDHHAPGRAVPPSRRAAPGR